MEFTRRGRAVAAVGLALLGAAAVLAAPALLWTAAAVGALLLGVGWSFARRVGAERDALEIEIEVEPGEPLVHGSSTVRLRTERPVARLPLRVTLSRPAAADGDVSLAVELDTHQRASRTEPLTWPVAGTYRLGPTRVAATDRLGLFRAAFEAGDAEPVGVRPRRPEIHVGRGGTAVAGAFGDHRESHSLGAGVVAATPEPYRPGMPIARIDWKATARLDDVYVVEPEAETDRRSVLLVDHRASTGVGDPPATPLGFVRHVALSVARSARAASDPLGCIAVGDDGVTAADLPDTGTGQYEAIETLLRGLEPTVPEGAGAAGHAAGPRTTRAGPATADSGASTAGATAATDVAGPATGGAGTASDDARTRTDRARGAADGARDDRDATTVTTDGAGGVARETADVAARSSTRSDPVPGASPSRPAGVGPGPTDRDPGFGRRAADALSGGDDAFARTLEPYFDGSSTYQSRVDGEALAAAARAYLPRIRGSLWTVVLTDDARRGELRKTVRLARRGGDRVVVLLAPRVLYEPGELADVEEAAARYRSFDEFRRELAAMDRVEALELAPGDRLSDVLADGGGRR